MNQEPYEPTEDVLFRPNLVEIAHEQMRKMEANKESSPYHLEAEVSARVEFKMKEFMSVLNNRIIFLHKNAWSQGFNREIDHEIRALNSVKAMLTKEMNMPTPFDDMADQKRRAKRDKAIEQIMERFCKRTDRDYHEKARLLAGIIENAQRWME